MYCKKCGKEMEESSRFCPHCGTENVPEEGREKQSDVSDNFSIENPMLYDRLHTLSAEYSMPVGTLVNLAAKRLVDDIDFVRGLRTGRIKTK